MNQVSTINQNQSPVPRIENPQQLAYLTILAIAGQIILLAAAWLLPAVSEYTWLTDGISNLALGSFGYLQTFAFVAAGLGTLALAYTIYKLMAGAFGYRTGALLVAIYGLGAILSAIFPTDPIDTLDAVTTMSVSGTIHVIVALISFVSIIAAMFLLTRSFMDYSRWRSRSIALMLLPASALPLLLSQSPGPLFGLYQRALVTIIALWLIIVASRLRALALQPRKEVNHAAL